MVSSANEGLSKKINNFLLSRNMMKTDKTLHKLMSHKMTMKFYMFGSLIENWCLRYIYGYLVVAFHKNGRNGAKSELMEKSAQPQFFSNSCIKPLLKRDTL